MPELFDIEFVGGVLDPPVAQIDTSLGQSGDQCAGTSAVFVIEGATQSGQMSCHSLHDRADRGGRGRSAAASPPLRSSHSPDGQLDVVGGACAHPDELPRRVMTTHPAAIDAGTGMASGGFLWRRRNTVPAVMVMAA